MKLVIHREPFLKAFSRAAIAAPARSNKEVLTNVLLTASNGESSLAATDLEIAVRVGLTAAEMDIDEGGKVLLPAHLFFQALKDCSDEALMLTTDLGSASLKGQRTQHRFQTSKVDEFPPIEPPDGEPLVIPVLAVAAGVKAANSQTCENTRYALGSVMIDVAESSTSFVGTNGSSMGELTIDLKAKKASQSLLPMKAAGKLVNFLRGDAGDLTLRSSDNWLRFDIGSSLFMARLGEGRFPHWQDVFPTRFETEVTLPVGPLAVAIRQATLTADNLETSDLRVALSAGELELSAQSETGKSSSAIPVGYEGRGIVVGLNWRLWLSVLSNFAPEDEIEMKLIDPKNAVLFAKDSMRFVIMPLTLE